LPRLSFQAEFTTFRDLSIVIDQQPPRIATCAFPRIAGNSLRRFFSLLPPLPLQKFDRTGAVIVSFPSPPWFSSVLATPGKPSESIVFSGGLIPQDNVPGPPMFLQVLGPSRWVLFCFVFFVTIPAQLFSGGGNAFLSSRSVLIRISSPAFRPVCTIFSTSTPAL